MTHPRAHPDQERERLERLGVRRELVEVLARPAANARRRLVRRYTDNNRHRPARRRAP